MDAVLISGTISIERKDFVFDLRENPRGRFLRITEAANGRRDAIVIPAPGLEEFRRVLDEIIAAHRQAESPKEG
jgi:PurA ssDNA and RNA-binding protein